MFQIIRADHRHARDTGWLKTYWLFSFSDYHDPSNVQFGKLRVFNDDLVEPGGGFPEHFHREMEIITLVLDGQLTHEDTMGNKSVIKANGVQAMSAGTGLSHSEFNLADKPLWLFQIWIYPNAAGKTPSYHEKHFDPSSFNNRLLPVASGKGKEEAIEIFADATIYRARLTGGRFVDYQSEADRNLFVYVSAGDIDVNGKRLTRGDQARITDESHLEIKAEKNADLILIDTGPR